MIGSIYKAAAGVLACGFLLGQAPAARAELDATKPHVLFDFENDTQGFTSTVETSVLSQNTDSQFATQNSKGSLKVDLTGHSGYNDGVAFVTLPEPVDLSRFAFIQADVVVPPGARGLDDQGNPIWSQVGLITQEPWIGLGNRDFYKEGLNRLVWSIDPANMANVTTFRFFVNSGLDWQGPIYIDNVTLLPGKAAGLVPEDQVLIAGFNTEADVSVTTQEWPRELNTDEQFVTEGAGSLKLDVTDIANWDGNRVRAQDLPPVDISQMDEIRLDVFVPQESAPDWYQFAPLLVHQSGELWLSTHGLMPGWNTLVWDLTNLTPEVRAGLAAVTGYAFISNSGGWRGPIYVDALRGSKSLAGAPAQSGGVKGDLNANGKLDISDVLLALQGVAGLKTLTADQTTAADINKNSKVDITDVVALLRAVAGISPLG